MTSGKTSDVTISLNMHRRKQETGLYIWRFKLGLISAFSVFPYVYFFSFFQITVYYYCDLYFKFLSMF